MSNQWHYSQDGAQYGPVDESEIVRLIEDGDLPPGVLVCRKGSMNWQPAREVDSFRKTEIYPTRKQHTEAEGDSEHPSSTPQESQKSREETSLGSQADRMPGKPAGSGAFMNNLSKLPKPIFFGLMGAVGCLIGGLFGEPVLSILKADTGGDSEGNDGAAPVLVFSPEMKARLARENAEAGAIEIALIWNAYDDLDLHCIDPSGSHIYYSNKRSPSGGWLDVDMNIGAGIDGSLEPVEHIRWQERDALEGEYHVSVVHYSAYSSGSIPFTVAIKANNELKEFKMTTGGVDQEVPVHTFRFEATPVSVSTPTQPSLKAALIIGIWAALLAICTSLLLVMGQNHLLRRPLLTEKSALKIILGSAFAGLLSGIISQYLFSLGAQSIIAEFPDLGWLLRAGLVVGWILLGGLLGAGMGWFIPNLPKAQSGFAGMVGGLLGALAFLLVSALVADLMGRIIGTLILGFAIGLMVALVERMTREAYLSIQWAPNEEGTVNLGSEPVTIGGRGDDVFVNGLPEQALSIVLREGRIICTQQPGSIETDLKDQSAIDLGKVKIVVHAVS